MPEQQIINNLAESTSTINDKIRESNGEQYTIHHQRKNKIMQQEQKLMV